MTTSQQEQSLALANEIRIERKVLRTGVRQRRLMMDDLLKELPRAIMKMEVGELLKWKPGWGQERVEATLELAQCSWSRLVKDLSERQVSVIIDRIHGKLPKRKPPTKKEPGSCERCGDSLEGFTAKKRFCPSCRAERDHERKAAWARNNLLVDCRGACGRMVWKRKNGLGYCVYCTPNNRGGDWSRNI